MSTPLTSTEVIINVAFHDCDAMAVVWHGHYFKYLEIARTALLQTFAYDYPQMQESGYLWPIIDSRIKYVASARYNDRLRVRASLMEWENRMRIDYLVFNDVTGQRLTRATTWQVAVAVANGEMQWVSPPIFQQLLRQHGVLAA